MSATVFKFTRPRTLSKSGNCVRLVSTSKYKLKEDDAEEIKIPVPWGHIAGKWWGSRISPPVLAIHGWQDNASTFDRLIPLLNTQSVLAIDLPGHGYSSHLPEGCVYDFGEFIIMLERIKRHFNWTQMPLLTHSYGGALGFVYSALFPSEVKWHVNIECGRSILTLFRRDIINSVSKELDDHLKIEKQKKEVSPPAYKLSQMIRMCVTGSLGSVASPEAALVLLKRGISLANEIPVAKEPSKDFTGSDLAGFIKFEKQEAMLRPEEEENFNKRYSSMLESLKKLQNDLKNFHLKEEDDKYYVFTRDPSIKIAVFQSLSEEFVIETSKHIKCPTLSFRTHDGFLHGSTRHIYEKTMNNLKTNSEYFEHHEIDGTHHVHLNSPQLLAPIINKFLQKFDV